MAKVFQFQTYRLCPLVLLSRIRLQNGALATSDDISAIKASVWGQKDPETPTLDNVDVPTSTITDLKGTPAAPDPRWNPGYEDDPGFNFEWQVPASAFPNNDHYRVEITFTQTTPADTTVMLIGEGPAISTGPYTSS